MYLAVDIGGTKTLVAKFSEEGEILYEEPFQTPADYADLIKTLKERTPAHIFADCTAGTIAIPGRADRDNGVGVVFGNRPWQNIPIINDFKSHIDIPLSLDNDANLAGLSEALYRKDRFRKVLYITVSTGIGSGFAIDGHISPDFQDAEIGFMLIEHEGKRGYWQDFASGTALVKQLGKHASEIEDEQDWALLAEYLSIGVINVCAMLNPEVIVFGGGVGKYFSKFENLLKRELAKYPTPMIDIPPIEVALNPDRAVIYGCYELTKMNQKS
jgi:predicted NBD/HSP70 family sugar kinase